MPPENPRPVIIDTDPGVDDALALILALRSPELKVELITTVAGNVSVEQATRNVMRVLTLLGRLDIPVARGSAASLEGERVGSGEVHGSDGLGDVDPARYPVGAEAHLKDQGAVEAIIEAVKERPGQVTLITLGPLTNIARALERDPAAMAGLAGIVAMIGAVAVPGNVTPVAEFNCYCDPRAAAVVFESSIPVTMVGLDVTHQVVLPRSAIQSGRSSSDPVARFVADCTARYVQFHEEHCFIAGCYLHDPLAVAIAIRPDLAGWRELQVEVETSGQFTRGMTVADFRPIPGGKRNARVCLSVDSERALRLIGERVHPEGSP